jgi:hypothetical protein
MRAAVVALALLARPILAETPAVGEAPAPAPAGPAEPIVATVPVPGDGARPVPLGPVAAPAPADQHHWFVLPVVSYLPETGFGGGVTTGMHVPFEGAPRPSSFFATAVYTVQGQGLLDLSADVAFPHGAVVAARARAIRYPDEFYGIGPDTPSSAKEHYTRRSVDLVATGELPVPRVRGLRAGARIELRAEDIDDVEAGGQLAGEDVTGAEGSSGAAGGIVVTWDRRDRIFWPAGGSMAQAWYVYAPDALSGTGAYGRGVLELRHFAPLGRGLVLGLHAYGEFAHGAVPFTILPRIGSTRMLRGIREGRYRDQLGWTLQSELRAPLWRRISGVAFGAVGGVADGPDEVRLEDAKVAGGAGLRYRLTDQGANVRLDVATSGLGVQFYLLVLEAF